MSLLYIKNKRLISQCCSNYIHHWESYSSSNPCESVLIRHIERFMDVNKDLISAQRVSDDDFKLFVLKMIAYVSFDMIVSNVFSGQTLRSLRFVHSKSMEELLYPGYISQREFDDDKITLKSISDERIPQIYRSIIEKGSDKHGINP